MDIELTFESVAAQAEESKENEQEELHVVELN